MDDKHGLKTLFHFISSKQQIDSEFNEIVLPKKFQLFSITDCLVIAHSKELICTWDIQEQGNGSLITLDAGGLSENLKEIVTVSKIEVIRKIVQTYLNREGVYVNYLEIENHPHGLEQVVPLKTNYLEWKMSIFSSRYDYTTWFNCLRWHPIDTVEIEWNGEDNTVFLEDVISSARTANIKTRIPLPIQAIMNFKVSILKMEQEISSDDLLKICGKWLEEGKPVGSSITMNMSNSDIGLLQTKFGERFSTTVEVFDQNGFSMFVTSSKSKVRILVNNGKSVLMVVVE